MTCTTFCNSSCPEPVSVQISQNIIQIGESTLLSTTDYGTLVGTTFPLSNVPYNARGMGVFVGGSKQIYGLNFTVGSTGILTFTDTAVVGEDVIVSYEYLSDSSGVSIAALGTSIPLMVDSITSENVGTVVPVGYLLLDGGALMGEGPGDGYLVTSYPALAGLVGASLGLSADGLNFATEVFRTSMYSGGQLVSFFNIIKY